MESHKKAAATVMSMMMVMVAVVSGRGAPHLLFANSFPKHFTHRNSSDPQPSHEAGVMIIPTMHMCKPFSRHSSRCLK